MSKISKKMLIGLIVVMMLGMIMVPVINKSMATDTGLDITTIMDEDQNKENETQNENTTTNGKDNKDNTQSSNNSLNDITEDENKNEENSENANTASNNEIPQTGVTEDITVLFFIGVCAVLAIFAYKKVGDYKIR